MSAKDILNALIICGDKGGIGKDLIFSIIYLAALEAGRNPTVHEVEMNRRLGDFFPDSNFYEIAGRSPEEILSNPKITYGALGDFAKAIAKDGFHLGVMGASLTTAFLRYSGEGEDSLGRAILGDGDGIGMAVVTTMQDASLTVAVENLVGISAAYPKAKRIVVLNDLVADFQDGDEYVEDVLGVAEKAGTPITRIRINRCAAPTWGHMMNVAPLHRLMDDDVKDNLINVRKQELDDVIIGRKMVKEWLIKQVEAVSPLIPAAPKAKAKATA